MSILTKNNVVDSALRASVPPEEVWCLSNYSFRDAIYSLKATARDASAFLLRLTTKVPLFVELDAATKDQFLTCETSDLSPDDGEPLLLCAILGWITVSFPSKPDWERDTLTVRFRELLPEDEWREAHEEIDNLACTEHARHICDRNRARSLNGLTPVQQWDRRDEAFPHLLFGLDVENTARNSDQLMAIIRRLQRLDNSVTAWQKIGVPIPPWSSDVTRESESTMNHPTLRSTRVFRSRDGTPNSAACGFTSFLTQLPAL